MSHVLSPLVNCHFCQANLIMFSQTAVLARNEEFSGISHDSERSKIINATTKLYMRAALLILSNNALCKTPFDTPPKSELY